MRTLRCDMESNYKINLAETKTEAELELLIAKYTLEYLYRWTNHFDAGQLAQIKQILDAGGESKALLGMIGQSGAGLPS